MAEAITQLPWFSSAAYSEETAHWLVMQVLVDLARFAHRPHVIALLDQRWIQAGGFTGREREILKQLAPIAGSREAFIDAIHRSAWLEDGVDGSEFGVLRVLIEIADLDQTAAIRILGFPFLDTVDPGDEGHLANLRQVAHSSTEVLRALLDKSWVQHPIERDELTNIGGVQILINLSALARASEVMALRLAKSNLLDETPLPSAFELTGVLSSMARNQQILFDSIMSKPWAEDIFDDDRIWMLIGLYIIGQDNEDTAVRIINSPFLDTVEPIDPHIVNALYELHQWVSPAAFEQAMTHPAIGGDVTAGFAEVISIMGRVGQARPQLFDQMLDPSRVLVEQRTIVLPLMGELTLTIVRTRPGAEASMDRLEATVRMVEEFMGVPFPRDYLVVLYDEGSEDGVVVPGISFRDSIVLGAYQDDIVDRSPGTRAHEVAHTYFGSATPWFTPEWLNEGVATIIQRLGDGSLPDRLEPNRPLCTEVETIAEFDYLYATDRGVLRGTNCHYSFGEHLFVDLYNTLGETAFRQGLGELYRMIRSPSLIRGDEVAEAFKANSPDQSAAIDGIVERWYGSRASN